MVRELTNTRRLMAGVVRAGAIVTFVSAAWADLAAQQSVTMSGERRTLACDGETLRITGQKNTVTVTGECRKVDVSGSNNTVEIESVASIEVTGTNNRITWQRALNGDHPRVSATGLNTVTRAAAPPPPPPPPPAAAAPEAPASTSGAARAKPTREPAPREPAPREPAPPAAGPVPPAPTSPPGASAAPPAKASSRAAGARRGATTPATDDATVTVLEDGREDSIDCRGREVSILGSRNTLRLRGSCPMVIVTGSDNEIDVDTTQRIRATGDRNRVVWTSVIDGAQTPRVENTGQQNRISKADRKPVSP